MGRAFHSVFEVTQDHSVTRSESSQSPILSCKSLSVSRDVKKNRPDFFSQIENVIELWIDGGANKTVK